MTRLLGRCLRLGILVLLWLFAATTAAAAKPPLYLTGGTVISMVPGQRPFRATVLVKDGRIAAIAPRMRLPKHAHVVDVSGRYLMPGFVDMHAHVTFLRDPGNSADPGYDRPTTEIVLRDLLAFGVTTVRNPAAPPAEGVALREDVAAGRIPGPRIFTAGWPLNGAPFASEAAIRGEVERQCALKVDYIKVYANSTPAQTAAAIDAAHRCGLKVIGHLQRTDWPTAADFGIDFLTHGVSWSPSVLPPDKRDAYIADSRRYGPMKARILWLESVEVDGPEMDGVIAALKAHHIPVDPTLVAYQTKFMPMAKYRGAANVRLAPPAMLASWRDDDITKGWTSADFTRMRRAWPKMLAIVNRYYRAGVMLTTGSDLPNPWVAPGVSLHQEMELLHQAGIPASAVLAMSTRNAAAALGLDREIGTVEVGKRADLVVLQRSPLTDIRNTRSVAYVVAKGRLFRPAELR